MLLSILTKSRYCLLISFWFLGWKSILVLNSFCKGAYPGWHCRTLLLKSETMEQSTVVAGSCSSSFHHWILGHVQSRRIRWLQMPQPCACGRFWVESWPIDPSRELLELWIATSDRICAHVEHLKVDPEKLVIYLLFKVRIHELIVVNSTWNVFRHVQTSFVDLTWVV